eukprot:TRINITY_DN63525_c0_g1_i1.p1 TRINITY_DN63525_c0_g1~~TRINITY_DN63525_c0_g1_i1.p1  ORF type:complete len:329 (-),score=70.77 TRINITY_DN63525_c0_g1_i1:7-993(-)
MIIDCIAHSLGIEVKDGTVVGLIPQNATIPATKEVLLKLVDPNQDRAVIHVREVSGSGKAWLGAVSVPMQHGHPLRQPGHDLSLQSSEDKEGGATFKVKIEVDAAGLVQVKIGDLLSEPLGYERNSALTTEELAVLARELRLHAGERWANYGQRTELSPRPVLSGPRRPAELGAVEEGPQDVDSSNGVTDVSSDEDEADDVRPPSGRTARVDARGKALAERLREKLQMRRKNNPAPASASAADNLRDSSFGLSSTEVCAVCLCTEAELGRRFNWVLEKCGHKCICKCCLRKMKAHRKQVQIECPMCRVRSRPVLEARYAGNIYAAEAG